MQDAVSNIYSASTTHLPTTLHTQHPHCNSLVCFYPPLHWSCSGVWGGRGPGVRGGREGSWCLGGGSGVRTLLEGSWFELCTCLAACERRLEVPGFWPTSLVAWEERGWRDQGFAGLLTGQFTHTELPQGEPAPGSVSSCRNQVCVVVGGGKNVG